MPSPNGANPFTSPNAHNLMGGFYPYRESGGEIALSQVDFFTLDITTYPDLAAGIRGAINEIQIQLALVNAVTNVPSIYVFWINYSREDKQVTLGYCFGPGDLQKGDTGSAPLRLLSII